MQSHRGINNKMKPFSLPGCADCAYTSSGIPRNACPPPVQPRDLHRAPFLSVCDEPSVHGPHPCHVPYHVRLYQSLASSDLCKDRKLWVCITIELFIAYFPLTAQVYCTRLTADGRTYIHCKSMYTDKLRQVVRAVESRSALFKSSSPTLRLHSLDQIYCIQFT